MKMIRLGVFLATLASFFATTLALNLGLREANSSSPSAFVTTTVYGTLTFAVTAIKDGGDLYFHLEAPAANSWVAVGLGSEMKDALMLVVYKSEDEKGVVLSPRTVERHAEPSFDDKIPCAVNDDSDNAKSTIVSQNKTDLFVVNGVCRGINGASYPFHNDSESSGSGNDKIDFSNTKASFIYALGPTDRHLHSDSFSAALRRHTLYGTFTLDVAAASVDDPDDLNLEALSKVGDWTNHDAETSGGPTRDRDYSGNAHAVMMCGTFVGLFPVGVIFLRILERVRWHAWIQTVGLVVAILGVGMGIYLGLEYNHSKDLNSAHQIVGLAVVGFTILQFALGLTHHLRFKKSQKGTPMGKIHLYLGPFLLLAGAVNGFLGYNFAGATYHNIVYGVSVAVVFGALALALFFKRRRVAKIGPKGRRVQREEGFEGFAHRGEGMGWVDGKEHRRSVVDAIDMHRLPPSENEERPVQGRTMV